MSKRYWSIVAAVAVLAALAGMYVARELRAPDPVPLASGTAYPTPAPLEPFSLVDSRGGEVTPESLRGHPTLVFFGFTNCPDVCPTTLAQLVSIQKQDQVPGLKVALITVDPERDTPEQIGRYVAAFGGDIIGLTGSMPEIVKAQQSFGAASRRAEQPGGGYSVDHSATVFVLDSAARKVAVFTPPLRPEAMARDLVALAPALRNR
jgi:protein SCO1/2